MDHIKVQNIHYYPYELSFERPFVVKGVSLERREGVIIHVISDKGHIGFGEAAPLLGMSAEPLKKSIHQLDRLRDELGTWQLPLGRDKLLRYFKTRFAGDILAPSVRFGLESAFLSMIANALNTSVAKFLTQHDPSPIFCAGLLQGGHQDVRLQLMTLKTHGYKVFDLKVGNPNIPLDIQKVEGLKSMMTPQDRLRLDADGAWSPQEAVIFAQSIGKNQVDYLEEPCQDMTRWEEIFGATDMPLAIGNSLENMRLEDLECSQGTSVIVVRPMIFGGISGFYDLVHSAKEMGKRVILGGVFESGVGQMMLANLAVLTGEVAALGCSNWLKTDLLARPLIAQGGAVFPEDLMIGPDMFHAQFRERLKAN